MWDERSQLACEQRLIALQRPSQIGRRPTCTVKLHCARDHEDVPRKVQIVS